MRRFLLSAALVAACGVASAQKLTYYPWTSNGYLQAITCSQNGQFIGGEDMPGQAFIANMKTGEIKYFASEHIGEDTGDNDACVNSVNDEGVGFGYFEGHAVKFDFNTGEYTKLSDESSLVKSATTDAALAFGVTYDEGYNQFPCFWNAEGTKSSLPTFSDEALGYDTMGYNVMQVSADGSTVVGAAIDNFSTYPMVIWHRNNDGQTYSLNVASRRFFDCTFTLTGFQKYDKVTAEAVSANGKWVALSIHDKATDEDGYAPLYGQVIARYDVEADTLGLIECPDASPELFYYANGIANDGTIIASTVDQTTDATKAFICPARSSKAIAMSEAFPEIKELQTMDANELNQPCAISGDGRYIVGYGYVDYDDKNLCLGSYVIDTKGSTSGVENVADSEKSSKVVASYDIAGRKLNSPKDNRLVINRFANGKSVKRIVK